MKRSIALIGMPAVGKTTLGKMLAECLQMEFVDTDDAMRALSYMPLQDVIDIQGLEAFRDLESQVLETLGFDSPRVISTGGSAVYSEQGMLHLKEHCKIIYLQLDYVDLLMRLGDLDQRGIYRKPDQTLQSLMDERSALYERYADAIVDCNAKTVQECLDEIIKQFNAPAA